MPAPSDLNPLRNRRAPIEIRPDDFRQMGYRLVDRIATFLASLPQSRVTPGETPRQVRSVLGDAPLPQKGTSPARLLEETAGLLFNHSLFTGHPRFWGYVIPSAAPLGMLADLLAAAVNPNVGAWTISPMASEIEAQTVRWVAELVGYPAGAGGLMVSGGNMANFVGFLAARRAKATWNIRQQGIVCRTLTIYTSKETHTWVQKAADLFGLGTDAIRWIAVDEHQRMDLGALEEQIRIDRENGLEPMMAVGAAGTVGTGAVDPLEEMAALCREHDLWFHVDGAYGAPAALLPEAPAALKGLALADSVAVDPHKWLYSPLEAGCALVRDPQHLLDAFSYHPDYYNFEVYDDEPPINYYEYGMQNSRGFRALKVWLPLRQVGREGYTQMIRSDIALAEALYRAAAAQPELEAVTHNLSITTFRYVPPDLRKKAAGAEGYLNDLNRELLTRLQAGGEAFISNTVLDGRYLLRACIINFRTTLADIEALPEIVVRLGRGVDAELRPQMTLKAATRKNAKSNIG